MGVYLLTIASYDHVYEDKYSLYALEWTRSWKCSFCGALAMISSELSVLVLTLITIERYKCITTDFRVVTASSARINLLLTWFISICLAIFPLIYWKGEPYYGSSSGLCFPLHINEPYNLGWQYSALVIIGINLTAVIVIAILYWKMFSTIKSDRKFARPALPEEKKKREDAILAFRFFAIVSTDCLCWLPIAAIKLIAFTSVTISRKFLFFFSSQFIEMRGKVFELMKKTCLLFSFHLAHLATLNAWLVVFILPINSALNPVIYTLAAPTELHHRLYKQCRRIFWSFRESLLTSQRETIDESGESNKVICTEPVSRSPSLSTTTASNGGHSLSRFMSPNNVTIDSSTSSTDDAACKVAYDSSSSDPNTFDNNNCPLLANAKNVRRPSSSSYKKKDSQVKYKLDIKRPSNGSLDHSHDHISSSSSPADEMFAKCTPRKLLTRSKDDSSHHESSLSLNLSPSSTCDTDEKLLESHFTLKDCIASTTIVQETEQVNASSRQVKSSSSGMNATRDQLHETDARGHDEMSRKSKKGQLLKMSKLNHHRIEERDDIERLHEHVTSSPSVVKVYSSHSLGKMLHVISSRSRNGCNKQLDKLISTQSDDSTDGDKTLGDCRSSLLEHCKSIHRKDNRVTEPSIDSTGSTDILPVDVKRQRNHSIAVTEPHRIECVKSTQYNRQLSAATVHSENELFKRTRCNGSSVTSSLLRGTYSLLIPSASVSSQESQFSNESIFPINFSSPSPLNGRNDSAI